MAIHYIQAAESRTVLDALGNEISSIKTELRMTESELESVKTAYVRRGRQLQAEA
jgi:hypothetical protein